MPDAAVDGLRLANRDLSAALERLQREGLEAIKYGLFAELRGHLRQAAACLRSIELDVAAPSQLSAEISEYRRHLQELSEILPLFYGRLLAERARLQVVGVRQEAVRAWAEAQQKSR